MPIQKLHPIIQISLKLCSYIATHQWFLHNMEHSKHQLPNYLTLKEFSGGYNCMEYTQSCSCHNLSHCRCWRLPWSPCTGTVPSPTCPSWLPTAHSWALLLRLAFNLQSHPIQKYLGGYVPPGLAEKIQYVMQYLGHMLKFYLLFIWNSNITGHFLFFATFFFAESGSPYPPTRAPNQWLPSMEGQRLPGLRRDNSHMRPFMPQSSPELTLASAKCESASILVLPRPPCTQPHSVNSPALRHSMVPRDWNHLIYTDHRTLYQLTTLMTSF